MNTTAMSDPVEELARLASEGQVADFEGRHVTLPAWVVKNLLLGIGIQNVKASSPCRVRIKHAEISGCLDLEDARGPGGCALPALELEECSLIGDGLDKYDDAAQRSAGAALNARHARLSRLKLKNCRIGRLDLSGATIEGDLYIKGLGQLIKSGESKPSNASTPSAPTHPPRQCWVQARGIRVSGSVDARNAQLRVHPKVGWKKGDRAEYALDLALSTVGGRLRLSNIDVHGGVNLVSGHVHADLWIDGGNLVAAADFNAFNGQSLTVDGLVGLTRDQSGGPGRDFRAAGCIYLYAARIGSLLLTNADLRSPAHMRVASHEGPDPPSDMFSIDGYGAVIRGDFTCNCKSLGLIRLKRSFVEGALSLAGGIYEWGCTDFSGSHVGRVELGGVAEPLELPDLESPDVASVSLEDCTISSGLRVEREIGRLVPEFQWQTSEARALLLSCYPGYWLLEVRSLDENSGLQLLSSYLLDGASLRASSDTDGTDQDGRIAFGLNGYAGPFHELNTRKLLKLRDEYVVEEYLRVFASHVWGEDGPFVIQPSAIVLHRGENSWNAQAKVRYGKGLYKADFEIGDDGTVTMTGDERVDVVDHPSRPLVPGLGSVLPVVWDIYSGNVVWPQPNVNGEWIEPASWPRQRIASVLEDGWQSARRESGKKARPERRVLVNLEGTSAGELDDNNGESWGGEDVRMRLDGFTYNRLGPTRAKSDAMENFPGAATKPKEESVSTKRIVWLNKQEDTRWSPQPYDQLAKVLRANGKQRDATEITLARISAEQRRDVQEAKEWCRGVGTAVANRLNLPEAKEWCRGVATTVANRLNLPERLKLWVITIVSYGLRIGALFVLLWLVGRFARIGFPGDYLGAFIILFALRTFGWLAWKLTSFLKNWRFLGGLASAAYSYLLGLLCRHGFSYPRALLAFGLLWLVGCQAVNVANYGQIRIPNVFKPGTFYDWPSDNLEFQRHVLVIETVPVSGFISDSSKSRVAVMAAMAADRDPATVVPETPCGDQIDAALYSLDILVPVLDLGQESVCTVSPNPSVFWWRVAKSTYAVLGAIMTSLVVLTFSGVLRRATE